ncbi:MAG: transketolase family protein [Candidatus Lokiarchaeota archaeon]|nr:transketolase family protein [Candidatus Lokiarchaeota archaeon]
MTENLALRDVFGNYLKENAEKYKNLVVLDADLSSSTKTSKFAEKCPNRFFNMGISEQNMMGTALGFAISGKMPVVSGFTIFTTGRAWEFARMACHDKLNVKIITTHGGIVGEDGSTHNALEDLSLMSSLPNLTILIPCDEVELLSMLYYSFDYNGPIYMRLPRGAFPRIHEPNYKFSVKDIDVLKEGTDYCLIGTGYGSVLANENAIEIEKELGVSLKVINLSCIKPINEQILLSNIEHMKGIVLIEEHNIYSGVGNIVSRIISKNHPKPMRFIGIEDKFVQSGKRNEILESYGLNKENIINKLHEIIKSNK